MRTNPKGAHRERWVHSHGCRRWFNVERHTVTNQILRVYPIGGTDAVAERPVEQVVETKEPKQGSGS